MSQGIVCPSLALRNHTVASIAWDCQYHDDLRYQILEVRKVISWIEWQQRPQNEMQEPQPVYTPAASTSTELGWGLLPGQFSLANFCSLSLQITSPKPPSPAPKKVSCLDCLPGLRPHDSGTCEDCVEGSAKWEVEFGLGLGLKASGFEIDSGG